MVNSKKYEGGNSYYLKLYSDYIDKRDKYAAAATALEDANSKIATLLKEGQDAVRNINESVKIGGGRGYTGLSEEGWNIRLNDLQKNKSNVDKMIQKCTELKDKYDTDATSALASYNASFAYKDEESSSE